MEIGEQIKQEQTLIDGNSAAAWAARLCNVQAIPNFPITPQTEIIEMLAKWKSQRLWNFEFLPVESEHSVLSAAIASEAGGVRTFTASSSQGTMLAREMFNIASGMRMPLGFVNCSRGLSAPITLWSDHCDVLALRDAGWLMWFAKNNQEVLDSIIMGYKIAEDRSVQLPFLVNMDGFIHSFTREPVILPLQAAIDKFLPKYAPKTFLDPDKPMSLGVPVMEDYMYFKSQQHAAQMNALKVTEKVCADFAKQFGRRYGVVESYRTDGAKIIFVSIGALSTTIQAAVDSLRTKGVKAGLLRLHMLRPFPEDQIKKTLQAAESVAVIDNNISLGFGGILYGEICSVLDCAKNVSDFVVGLGGKRVGRDDFENIAKKALRQRGEFWVL